MIDWTITPLNKTHNRKLFSCGESELDTYFRQYARQHHDAGINKTYCATPDGSASQVIGFYSLSMGNLSPKGLPAALQKKFPRFPLPIARLTRLAVHTDYQKQGLGEDLLMHALTRCYCLSQEIGMIAIVIDAKHEQAKNFYLRYEFEQLPGQPLTLWLPVPVLETIITEASRPL